MKIKKLMLHLHLPASMGASIFTSLENLTYLGERIMTTITEIQETLAAVAAAAAQEKVEVTDALNGMSAQIAELQAQIAAGAGVTAADLDALQATATALVAQVQVIKE